MATTFSLTAEIPSDRRLRIDLPKEVPPGRAEITLTVTPPEDDEGPTLGDLRDSKFFGMWANRTDITDSVDFARQLRRRAWDRQS